MNTSVLVESSGPPWVITWTWVNRLNAEMVMVTRMKVLVCRRAGQVMNRNCCQLLAPSMEDASYMSCEMVCRPESQMTMWKPTPCQTDMNRIEASAVVGLPSQSGPLKPICASNWLIRPSWRYMNSHSIEMTTIEVTTGRKYTVRKKLTPLTFTLINSARARARPAWIGTTKTAKRTVLRSDFQNTGSWASRVKLSMPTNCGPCGETSFALVNARAKVRAIGMRIKVTPRTAAGAISQAAVIRCERCGFSKRRCLRVMFSMVGMVGGFGCAAPIV